MSNIAGSKSSLQWVVHISVALLVMLWLFPTLGLFVSSFRTADQISTGGWWTSLFPAEQNLTLRSTDPDDEGAQTLIDGVYVVEGNLFKAGVDATISVWGTSSRAIDTYVPGDTAELKDGETITVQINGDYVWTGTAEMTGRAVMSPAAYRLAERGRGTLHTAGSACRQCARRWRRSCGSLPLAS